MHRAAQDHAAQPPRKTTPHTCPRKTTPHNGPRKTTPHARPRKTTPHTCPRKTTPHTCPRKTTPHNGPRKTTPHARPRKTTPHTCPRDGTARPLPETSLETTRTANPRATHRTNAPGSVAVLLVAGMGGTAPHDRLATRPAQPPAPPSA
ncbi:hypothetical protein [Actinoplanes sp. M2I2]|uniref:hypothetical protein n=1 Tax=Actinoplanes sp. M2I2 TaxID=1734444 RepID=UPI0020218DAB|nr:hypothetical protein [Actinoplanes sp. M2I2]